MLVLIVYDTHSSTEEGRRRLMKVARYCELKGKRIQNSVFECLLGAAAFRETRKLLLSLIDEHQEKLRFYNLGNSYESRIDRIGKQSKDYYENPIIL